MQTSCRRIAAQTPSRSASIHHHHHHSSTQVAAAARLTRSSSSTSIAPPTQPASPSTLSSRTSAAARSMSSVSRASSAVSLAVSPVDAHPSRNNELYTLAESLLAQVRFPANASHAPMAMLSQSPARSPLFAPVALPSLNTTATNNHLNPNSNPVSPSAARRFEGKESTRGRCLSSHHHAEDVPNDGRGRNKSVKVIRK